MENQTEQKIKQSGLTLEDLMKKKSPLEKIKNYPLAIVPVSLWLVFLLVIFSLFWKNITLWQSVIMIIVSLLSVINLCLCLMTKHTDEINKFKPHVFWSLTIFSIVIFSISALTIQWKVSGNISQIIWLAFIVFVCIMNILVTMRKRDGINSIENTIKQLKFIEIIASIIALLQLIIAIPQLKNSYKSATSDDMKSLADLQKNLFQHTQQFVIADIPNGLQNDEVIKARTLQMKLYTDVVGLSSLPTFDFTIEQDTDEFLMLEQIVTRIDDSIDLMSLQRKFYLKITCDIQAVEFTYNDSTKYPYIYEMFSHTVSKSEDIHLLSLLNTLLDELQMYDKKCTELLRLTKKMRKVKDKRKLKILRENVIEMNYLSKKVFNSKTNKEIMEFLDKKSFRIIKALNYIQFYYAYDNAHTYTDDYMNLVKKEVPEVSKFINN